MYLKDYSVCPICGYLTDDGTIIHTEQKTYLVCFDCSDNVPGWILQNRIEKMEQDGTIRKVRKNGK